METKINQNLGMFTIAANHITTHQIIIGLHPHPVFGYRRDGEIKGALDLDKVGLFLKASIEFNRQTGKNRGETFLIRIQFSSERGQPASFAPSAPLSRALCCHVSLSKFRPLKTIRKF